MARLYKRGKVWYCDVFIQGKRVRDPLDKDHDIALSKLTRLIEQKDAARFGRDVKDITWEEFKKKFLPQKPHRVTQTLYRGAIHHLEEFAVKINNPSEVTPAVLAQAKAAWKAEKRGFYAINRHVRCIKAMMRVAESWGYIPKHDWTAVKEDREPKGRLLWYEVNELKKLLNVCKGMWKTLTLLGSRAGLRRSEIYWLAWDDVDYARKRVHVSPKKEWTPKDHEARWVPMPPDLEKHLRSLKREGRWVLTIKGKDRPSDQEGQTKELDTLSSYFKKLVRQAGLKGSIHTLRHTYASHLANGGETPKAIMMLLGHSELEMVDKYLHLAPSTLQNAAKSLPDL